jgi:tape measure domain-containing protein
MDADGYIRKAGQVTRAQKDLAEGFDRTSRSAKKAQQIGYEIGTGMRAGLDFTEKLAKAFIGLDIALVGAGLMASKKAADFESLTLALAAVDGGAKNAEKSLAKLKEIAKGPGLGVEEAISTYAGLRRGGVDAGLAMSLTGELGNAVARGGGGKEMLGRAGLAMGQMATKPFLQGEELNQLTEAGIPAYKIVKDAFGTADTEELKKRGVSSIMVLKALNEELHKMERVSGGSKNAFENLSDALEQGVIGVGTGINTVLTPMVNSFAAEIEKLNSSGDLKTFGTQIAEQWKTIFEALTGGTDSATTAIDSLMEASLALGYATENVVNNVRSLKPSGMPPWLRDIIEVTSKPIDAMTGGGSKAVRDALLGPNGGSEDSTDLSPMGLARQKTQERELQRELARRRAKKAGLGEDVAADEPKKDEPSQQTRILKEIADNTKPLRDIRDVMLGGGTFSRNAFNPVNMGAWTGSQGQNQIHKGFQMIMSGLAASVNGQFVDLARQRHLDPGAL